MEQKANKIIATGTLYGDIITITITERQGKLQIALSDKELLKAAKIRFKCCQESLKPLYGCFLFPKNTLRSAEMALKNGFFENKDFKITVEGELEKMPCEDGSLY